MFIDNNVSDDATRMWGNKCSLILKINTSINIMKLLVILFFIK